MPFVAEKAGLTIRSGMSASVPKTNDYGSNVHSLFITKSTSGF
jgi:hypothetical protein